MKEVVERFQMAAIVSQFEIQPSTRCCRAAAHHEGGGGDALLPGRHQDPLQHRWVIVCEQGGVGWGRGEGVCVCK